MLKFFFVTIFLFSLTLETSFAQKKKSKSNSLSKERIRILISSNSLAEETPDIYISNYDSVSEYKEINRKHRSLTYVSGWLFDIGLGVSESKIEERFTYETGMQEIQVEQDIRILFYELSLLFGDTFTAQPGFSYADEKSNSQFIGVQREYSSNAGITQLDYEVEFSGEGYAYFINFGVDLWGLELIAGYRKEFILFDRYDRASSTIKEGRKVFKISSYNNIGIGYTF